MNVRSFTDLRAAAHTPQKRLSGKLGEYFCAIYVISLDKRTDRRKRLASEMIQFGLAEPSELKWFRAVSGEQCWAPGFFAAGAGAWGCLQSHLGILQDAIMENHDSILILEDDATFHPRASEMLDLFFKQVPGDWDQVFIGGEHFHPPDIIKHRPFVLTGNGVHRTHAFGMKRSILPVIYQHMASYPDYMKGGEWHVDHQLGAAHLKKLWKTYTPAWWIVGQKGGTSNIADRENPDLWWHPSFYAQKLPFVWADQEDAPSSNLQASVHFGNHLAPGTLIDTGLHKCVENTLELFAWMRLISHEALEMNKLPGICHPGLDQSTVKNLWPAATVNLAELKTMHSPSDYPFNGLFKHVLNDKKAQRNGFSL